MYLANNMQGPYAYQLNSWMGYPAKIKSQQQLQLHVWTADSSQLSLKHGESWNNNNFTTYYSLIW
jgi:hypothetical protein